MTVKEKILQTLKDLRAYALEKGYVVSIFYHEEDSYLVRFANSAISLNTNEHLIRLSITAYEGKKRAEYGLITDLSKLDEIKQGIDTAAEMVKHAQPLTYQPTIPDYKETFIDETGYDKALAQISNDERLAYFNQTVARLETDEIKLGGIFASGYNVVAMISTPTEHIQYFKTSDAQISVVLAHSRLKWEVTAEQSAQKKADLDAGKLNRELAFLVKHYQSDPALQIPLGSYDIVFGATAISDMISFFNWVAISGGSMKRGFSFIGEDQVGQKVFSNKFNLYDDPDCLDTYPFKRDFVGMVRRTRPFFKDGVFQGFAWYQDDADEFGAQPTGDTVMHKSLVMAGGDMPIGTLEELVAAPRDKDLLYIPFLHYMNIVNPSKGVITASSRFGALLLKKDGSVVVPYNVRLTQSLLDIFGDKVAWISQQTKASNTSASYGARNPTAIVVPSLMRVNDLAISHSNSSY